MKNLFLIFLQFLLITVFINLYAINNEVYKIQNFNKKNTFSRKDIKNNDKNKKELEKNLIDINDNDIKKSFILNDINIYTSFLSKETILDVIKLKLGDKIYINNTLYNNIINNLWDSGLFYEDIKIKIYRESENKITIDIFVQDLPRIYSLNFLGINKDIFNTISKKYNIKLARTFKIKSFNKVKEEIINLYNENGYPNIDIICNVKKKLNNNISLYCIVNKKNKIKINDIIFKGNNNFSNLDFDKNIEHNNIDSNSLFIIKKNNFFQKIQNKYNTKGFINYKFLSNIFSSDKNQNYLNIHIYEGNPFFINKINILGNKFFNKQDLYTVLKIGFDNPYDLKKIYKRLLDDNYNNSLISNYIDNGYVNTNISSHQKYTSKNKVNLNVKVIEGQQSILNNIDYYGNKHTNDSTISQYLNTYVGDIFSRKNINNTITSLSKSGIFDPNKISVKIKPYRNKIDIKYKIFEKNPNQIQFQGGYNDKNLFGNLSINFNNLYISNLFNRDKWNPLPQGNGEKLSLYSQISLNNQSYGFTFINPYLFNNRLLSLNLGSSYSINKNIDTPQNDSNNSLITNNLYLGINKKIPWKEKNIVLTIYSIYDRYNRHNTTMGYINLPKDGVSNDINNNVNLIYNSLNKDSYHTDGLNIDLKGIFTLPYSYVFKNIQNDKWAEYFKLKTKLYSYHEIFKNFVIKTGGECGLIGYYNNTYGSSPFKRFYLGGTNNLTDNQGRDFIPLRGYSDFESLESVTPQEGGEIYSRILTECRYPIIKNDKIISWLLSFFEAGGILGDIKTIKKFSLKKSIGGGIRVSINNLGLIGFDLGYGFENSIINNKSKFRTHFIIGNQI